MEKRLTVKELLNGGADGFDPMNLDTSEIRDLSNALPKDGNIDLNNAEVLATKYLRGSDICSELAAIATAHAQKSDTLKKKAYSEAALVKSKTAGIKTDKSRAWFAEMDDDYIEASNKYSEAIAFVKWVNNKYDSFNKMHYMCKKILDRGYAHERMAGFNGNIDNNNEPAW
jgi:hypothetical protein